MRSTSDQARGMLLVVLAACAGAFDAMSYLRLHTFTANMTGNTVLLGLWLGGRHLRQASHGIAAIAGYALGAFTGELLARDAGRHDPWPARIVAAFVLEAALVVAFTVLWPVLPDGEVRTVVLLAIGAAAMGTQAALAHGEHLGSATTTAMTGTIARSAEKLADALKRGLSGLPLFKPSAWVAYLCAALAVGAVDRFGGDVHAVGWAVAGALLVIGFGGRRVLREAPRTPPS